MATKVYVNPNAPLATNWWAMALRGGAALLFGILTITLPSITFAYLLAMFAIFALVDGLFNIFAALKRSEGQDRWWALLLAGVVSILAAVAAVAYPGLTTLTLLYLVAGWAIWSGVMEIVAAYRLRKQISNEWLLGLRGLLAIAFGLLLILRPQAGVVALLLWLGVFAIVSGVMLLVLAFRLRGKSPASEVRMA